MANFIILIADYNESRKFVHQSVNKFEIDEFYSILLKFRMFR